MSSISESDINLAKAFSETKPENIRNVCIIAHVDHGKTSLCDALISSNGIISSRMAGKLRYMDSRSDEQTRGITMKSSGISLYYNPVFVNLIDSPGHVDFGSEVISAIDIADISILVIDVVEGICSQTETVLRQAIKCRHDVILVINKIDRLIIELGMDVSEAYKHMRKLVEHANSCLSQILQGYLLDDEWIKIDDEEARIHFDPAKGNVIFASAVYGFGFGLEDFALLWHEKLKIGKDELKTALFSDSYIGNGGKIMPDAEVKGKNTVFETLVLTPLWEVYKCAFKDADLPKLQKMGEKMGITTKSKRVPEAFEEFMKQWMPLTKACVRAVYRCSSAKVAYQNEDALKSLLQSEEHPLWEDIKGANEDSVRSVLIIVKVLNYNGRKIGMCRVLSGRVNIGDELFNLDGGAVKEIVSECEDSDEKDESKSKIEDMFIMMGKELIPVSSVGAGQICGIALEKDFVGRTLCSDYVVNGGITFNVSHVEPLVRVSVFPACADTESFDELRAALKLLTVLDSSVRVFEADNGELTLITAGEVHLQKCIEDLKDLGQKSLTVSEPVVPFMETIIPEVSISYLKIVLNHLTECNIKIDLVKIKLRAVPLPDEIVAFLHKNGNVIKKIRSKEISGENGKLVKFRTELRAIAAKLLPGMKGTWWMKKNEVEVLKMIDKIWSFGPSKAKANFMVNNVYKDEESFSVWDGSNKRAQWVDQAFLSGFDVCMSGGPLCDEPLQGVAIIIEEFSMAEGADSTILSQLMSAVKGTINAALKKLPLRLVAATYKCTVQASSSVLGKVHTVLSQRRAKTLNEDINQANGLFEIESVMPIIESFGFVDDLRKSTSGNATAQMEFSHWQLISEDPFWLPTTEEEIEHFGEKGDSVNQAKLYMDAIRRRKGLLTDDMIVVNAEKQRNLSRNK
uniref:Tr-type G domain-containing protein n=1 Tax=Rhabditophanes sp. KR3021 TaxID=114890 RepID=A0AC35U464_9BILA